MLFYLMFLMNDDVRCAQVHSKVLDRLLSYTLQVLAEKQTPCPGGME